MRTVKLTKESTKDILENLLKRSPNNYGKFESTVAQILDKVKNEGDAALFAYTKEFDKADVTKETIRVTDAEIEEAYAQIDPALLGVIRKALVNIRQYHEKQIQNSCIFRLVPAESVERKKQTMHILQDSSPHHISSSTHPEDIRRIGKCKTIFPMEAGFPFLLNSYETKH